MSIAATIPAPSEVHRVARASGWYDNVDIHHPFFYPAQIALINGEGYESIQTYRKFGLSKGEAPREEDGNVWDHADAILRHLDLCEAMGWDIIKAINEKHEYNKTRPYRHGNKVV